MFKIKNSTWFTQSFYVFCSDLKILALYDINTLVLCNRGEQFSARYALSPISNKVLQRVNDYTFQLCVI